MHRHFPAIDYPPSQDGYWSPVTSTLNWCEEDYYATIYAAEIVNTLTNLLFISLAVKGVLNCYRHGHDQIFLITYAGYFCVGFGSLFFHATLKYPWQLVDELSMIYTTAFACYASFSYRKTNLVALYIALSLVSLCVFITAYYHYLQDPSFHQIAYAILTVTVVFRSVYVMEVTLRPSLKKRMERSEKEQKNAKVAPVDAAEQKRRDERDSKILTTMWWMIAYGLSVFLGGFAIWTLDNELCSTLRRWRRDVGLPWGILLEGHGWWHLMTGIGAYFFIAWGTWLRHCLNGKQDQYELRWPRLITSLPVIVRKYPARGSSLANGTSKKEL